MTVTVDITGITGEPGDPARVQITRITGRPDGGGTSNAKVYITGITGAATGGPAPDPAYVRITGLHGFARDPAPIAGESLVHVWNGSRLVQVTPMVWNGTGLEAT